MCAPNDSIAVTMVVNISTNMDYIIPREKNLQKYIEMENNQKVEIEKLNEIEEMLNKRRWAKDCLRCNIAEPEQIIYRGKIKVALIQSQVLHEKEAKLWNAIKDIVPEWWGDETQVLLNKNVTCRKHVDGNKSYSYILWLGDFTGGALLFEDGTRLEEKHVWHKIDGRIPHWNEPHEGTKYGIVLYRRACKHTKQQVMLQAHKRKVALAKAQEEAAKEESEA